MVKQRNRQAAAKPDAAGPLQIQDSRLQIGRAGLRFPFPGLA